MKKKLKKSLALILTLAIVTCLMPAAFAADAPVYATGISPTSQNVSIFVGKTTTLTVTVTPSNYDQGVEWETSDAGIVALNGAALPLSSGGQSTQSITGMASGTANVTAKVTKSSGEFYTATFAVTVKEDSVSSVAVTTTVSDIKTSVSSVSLYLNKSLQLHSLTTYASGNTTADNNVTWEASNPSIVNTTSGGVITANSAGTTTITARSTLNSSVYKSISVTVSSTPAITIRESSGKSTVVKGGTLSLTLSSTNGCDLASSGVTWSSSNPSIARISSTDYSLSNTVIGVAGGSATITAAYAYKDENNKSQTVFATYTVTVSGGDITAVSLDSSTYLGLGYYTTLTAASTPANAAYKSVSWTSSNPYVATVSGSTLSASVYGRSEGTSVITVTVTSNAGRVYTASSQVAVTDLSSTGASDTAVIGTTMTLANISDMLTAKFVRINNIYPSASATITFSSMGSSTYGTLYKSGSTLSWNAASANTAYKFSSLAAMTFVPSKSGTYTLPYTLKDTGTSYIMSGTITINVGTSALVVNVNLSSNAPYQFSSAANADGVAVSTLIYSTLYAKYSKAYSYIVFASSATSGSAAGTLYADSTRAAVLSTSSSRTFYASSTTKPVSGLYFVPAAPGTYVHSFTAYDASGSKMGDCELHIIVPGNLISAYYNMKPNDTLALNENLFASWFKNVSGTSYLSYVTIDSASNSTGAFSYDGTGFLPGSGVVFYSTSYSGTKSSNSRYINSVKYKSSNFSYCTYVNFTCYGGTTSGAAGVVRTGTLAICVTPGTVSDIDYAVTSGTSKTLDSASFTNVYKTATNTTAATAFRIQILKVPANGSLYYGYVSSASMGTLLTDRNCANYQLFANNSSAAYVIDRLTYVPVTNLGSESIYYAVYNTSGTLLYCGKADFNTGSKTFTCHSEGYTCNFSDFYSSSDADPIVSIKFSKPSSGSLYYNYANGGGAAVTNTTKFYTHSARTGEIAITKLTYIPAAGHSGKITISYTATTTLGKTRTGTLIMTVNSKTLSSYFTDVTYANTGSWAANAIDYCASWSLVSGTGTSTFSPTATMNRAMLVSVLYKAAGSPAVSGSNPFRDVSSSQYYYKAVLWANKNGIVTGTSTRTFNPGGAVTREQIAAILYKYARHNGTPVTASSSLSGYSDRGKISSYAVTPMQWAVGKGIISGTGAGTISPKTSAIRAQVAVMLHKYLTT